MVVPPDSAQRRRFAGFALDLGSGELYEGDKRIRLQEQSFQILRRLLERPGDVVTREELQQQLWPEGTFVDFEHGLNAAIKRLRVALGDTAGSPRFVETLPRRGYRFIAPVDGSHEGAAAGENASVLPGKAIAATASAGRRLAVLPFANLSADPAEDYFSDGLTEELIAQLGTACRGHLGIIGRWSAMTFKGTSQRASAIGETLRAGYLLEGSVRRDGDRVRITVRLIEAPSETQLWTESYERVVSELRASAGGRLTLQTDVASRIARALALELVPEVVADSAATGLQTDIYQAYLKGRYHWNNRGEEGLDDALAHFEHVVTEAPEFGAGYAAISRARTASAEYYRGIPRYELERAHAAALRALALEPGLSEAHLAMADARRLLKWEWTAAAEDYERAIQLNPSAEAAHRSYGAMLVAIGRGGQAVTEAERACELDPLCLISSLNRAWVSYAIGDFDHTINRCRHVLDMEPGRIAAHRLLGAACWQTGARDEAMSAFEAAVALDESDPVSLTWLAYARGAAGDRSRAEALVASARALTRYVSPYNLALAYTGLGQIDAAFRALDEARLDRDPMLMNLVADRRFAPLQADNRYGALLAQLNLASEQRAAAPAPEVVT